MHDWAGLEYHFLRLRSHYQNGGYRSGEKQMTWISESGNMWFPHQVRKLVDPLDEKIEKLHCELEESEAMVTQLKSERDGSDGKHIEEVLGLQCDLRDRSESVDHLHDELDLLRKAIEDALTYKTTHDPDRDLSAILDILSKAIKND